MHLGRLVQNLGHYFCVQSPLSQVGVLLSVKLNVDSLLDMFLCKAKIAVRPQTTSLLMSFLTVMMPEETST